LNTQDTTPTQSEQDKQVTVAVPEDRLPEFYAFFGRFLAVGRGRGGRGPHAHRGPRHGGRRCGSHQDIAHQGGAAVESAGPTADAESAA